MIIHDDPDGLSRAMEAYGANRASEVYGANRAGEHASDKRQAEIREVARQFEALLMHTLLKSMRETTSQDGLLDNDQTRLYTSLLDQEIAQLISRRGLGLAEILERQLSRMDATSDAPPWQAIRQTAPGFLDSWNAVDSWNGLASPGVAAKLKAADGNAQRSDPALPAEQGKRAAQADNLVELQNSVPKSHVREFIDAVRPHAISAAERSGIPAPFLIGHAALESGWGRYQIRHPDGGSSHNLFGIKADASWSGDVAEVMTTEYVGGMPVKRVEQFRSYDSYQAAFIDYADFLQSNPRYARALQATGDARAFASELQSAGYATDPRYADKLTAVINHSLLREARWT